MSHTLAWFTTTTCKVQKQRENAITCPLANKHGCTWIIFHWLCSTLGSWPLIFSLIINFTDCRTPWTSDQLVARPPPKHRTTRTQNKHIHTPNIHALSGIRAHDPGFRASENSSCLRPVGYRDLLRTSIQDQTEPQRNTSVGEKHNYCT
jgi:hypothetical protein